MCAGDGSKPREIDPLPFSTPQQFHELNDMPDIVEGLHKYNYLSEDSTHPSGLLKYWHGIAVPITPGRLGLQGLARLNEVVRHELGHAADTPRLNRIKTFYSFLINDNEQSEGVGTFFGVRPKRIARIARRLGLNPLLVLHSLDPGERAANRFERRNSGFSPLRIIAHV